MPPQLDLLLPCFRYAALALVSLRSTKVPTPTHVSCFHHIHIDSFCWKSIARKQSCNSRRIDLQNLLPVLLTHAVASLSHRKPHASL